MYITVTLVLLLFGQSRQGQVEEFSPRKKYLLSEDFVVINSLLPRFSKLIMTTGREKGQISLPDLSRERDDYSWFFKGKIAAVGGILFSDFGNVNCLYGRVSREKWVRVVDFFCNIEKLRMTYTFYYSLGTDVSGTMNLNLHGTSFYVVVKPMGNKTGCALGTTLKLSKMMLKGHDVGFEDMAYSWSNPDFGILLQKHIRDVVREVLDRASDRYDQFDAYLGGVLSKNILKIAWRKVIRKVPWVEMCDEIYALPLKELSDW